MTRFGKLVSVLLALLLVAALAILGYTMSVPKGPKDTEFYLLGRDGKTEGYPVNFVMLGNSVAIVTYDDGDMREAASAIMTVGIVNHEREKATFAVRLSIDGKPVPILFNGSKAERTAPITLADGARWEHVIGFAPERIGEKQKVEFLLEKNGIPYIFKNGPPYILVDARQG